MTRIAFISDIHANALALQAVLADIRHNDVDQIVCLGDVSTLGPAPVEALEMIQALNCPCVMGNHDEFLLEPELIHSYGTAQVVIDEVDWSREQLSAENLDFIKTFQRHLCIRLDNDVKLLCYHGSPHSHMDTILATTPAEDVDHMLRGFSADVMLGGHTHLQMLRQHNSTLLVNPGSVGHPFYAYANGQQPKLLPHAEYAIVQSVMGAISVEMKRVKLATGALYTAAKLGKNPLRNWLMDEYRYA